MPSTTPAFTHRSYYVNFASHLLNSWNANMMHANAGNRWGIKEFGGLLDMIKAFGFTCFEYWLEPTVYKSALNEDDVYRQFVETMQQVNDLAHARGLKTKYIVAPNILGHEWYFACPKITEDKALMVQLWRQWAQALKGTDIVGIFPGDPGGCRRNGCDHNTFIELALELTDLTIKENPAAIIEVGTWGTPFTGWGEDMHDVPNWDGSWPMLLKGTGDATNGVGCHIWNGKPDRAKKAMDDFIKKLPEFPKETLVAINLGFSPDADATMGGDAREYAREIARLRRIVSWDYSVTEGELIVHPHWRLPRIFSRRREERTAAPYYGAMSYTMSPKLSHLSMYAAAQAAIDPDRDPDLVSREFCRRVFGPEHEMLGELFEAFEVVNGWGHHPRRLWSREESHRAYLKIIDHLEQANTAHCDLPLFPSPQEYHHDILWFAKMFAKLSGSSPDREGIRKEYWQRTLNIYDNVPMSVDERAEAAAKGFSQVLS
jgi:hypothetical protein